MITTGSINTGTGDLTLNGNMGIMLSVINTTLQGGAVELTGVINDTRSDTSLTIMAMGDLTINSNISSDASGGSELNFTAGLNGDGNIITRAATAPVFTTSRIIFVQDDAFAGPPPAFTIMASRLLSLTTGEAQTVYPWMVAAEPHFEPHLKRRQYHCRHGDHGKWRHYAHSDHDQHQCRHRHFMAPRSLARWTLNGADVIGGMNPSDARATLSGDRHHFSDRCGHQHARRAHHHRGPAL